MDEIEVKILEINKAEIIKKLEKFGVKKIAQEKQKSYFFDFPDCRLRKEKRSLRLRSFGDKIFVTSKKAVSSEGVKIEDELEFDVSSIGETEKIFLAIGLEKKDVVECVRTKFKIDDVSFEIDEYPGVPCFMEIEAPLEKQVHEWVEKLDLDKSKVRAWGGRELFAHYGIKVYT
jgi:adenylate cyclase, class 2